MNTALMLGLWIQALTSTPLAVEPSAQSLGKVLICTSAEHGDESQTCKPYRPPTGFHHQKPTAQKEDRLVFLDPRSLERVEPSMEQLEELTSLRTIEERLGAQTEPVDVEYLADGTVRIRLNERFLIHRTISIHQPDSPRSDEASE